MTIVVPPFEHGVYHIFICVLEYMLCFHVDMDGLGIILIVVWLVFMHVHVSCDLYVGHHANVCSALGGLDQSPYVGILRLVLLRG